MTYNSLRKSVAQGEAVQPSALHAAIHSCLARPGPISALQLCAVLHVGCGRTSTHALIASSTTHACICRAPT